MKDDKEEGDDAKDDDQGNQGPDDESVGSVLICDPHEEQPHGDHEGCVGNGVKKLAEPPCLNGLLADTSKSKKAALYHESPLDTVCGQVRHVPSCAIVTAQEDETTVHGV